MMASSLCQRLSAVGPVLLPVLLDAAIKGLVILSLTALAVLAMRRASAAARHLVWLVGTVSLLILPILSAALPAWHVLPQWANNVVAPAPAPIAVPAPVLVRSAPDNQLLPNEAPTLAELPAVAQAPAAATPLRLSTSSPLRLVWQTWVLLAWLAGSALLLGYVALGFASLRWLQRRSSRITSGSWPILLRQLCDQIGLGRPVQLLSSPHRTMPMTWGIWRTRLLLPEDSTSWSNEQRRTVLLHELAHAKRWDCLTQLVVQVACALYWFNPLLWLAWKRIEAEREQACDDLVLSAGTKASAYAEQLLHIASEMPAVRYSAAAIAMARPSQLEDRLLAILDVTRNRRNLTRWGVVIAAAAAMALIVPMACMKAAGQEHQTPAQPAAQTDAGTPANAPAASTAAHVRHFVMLVIAPNGGMTFQGNATNWDKLPALLEQVPDRSHTVLCLAWTSDQVTVGQLNEARAGQLAQQLGFEYLSSVGEHPLGAMGGPDHVIEETLNAKVARVQIDKSSREDVIKVFGRPISYTWGYVVFGEDHLPADYIMIYPGHVHLWMQFGLLNEIRFEEGPTDYTFPGGLRVGSSLDDVLKVLGQPIRTVEGKANDFEEGVLYKDIPGGPKGWDYYQRSDKGIRLFFEEHRVIGLYLTEIFKVTPATTRAGGDAELLAEDVNKTLADFPEALDLSTPQSAWAAWQRACIAKNGSEAALSWVKLDPAEQQSWWQQQERDDPVGLAIYTTALSQSKLIEVWVYRQDLAETISYLPFPEGKGRDPYSLRSFGLIDGTWKNLGEDRYGSLDEARETARAKAPRMWSYFLEIKPSPATPPTTQPAAGHAAAKQEAGKTISLYVHNGAVQMRMGNKVVEAARIEIDPVGGPVVTVEAYDGRVRLRRSNGDELVGDRIEIAPDGQIAAKGGIIPLMQNARDGQGN
jgi:beta-lactamase regulating signal transducer with metallopeptidase domain